MKTLLAAIILLSLVTPSVLAGQGGCAPNCGTKEPPPKCGWVQKGVWSCDR